MFTRPTDLSDPQVVEALGAWGLRVEEIEYVPVGFGSHHWRVVANGGRWFVNVDDLDTRWTSGPYAEPARALLRPHADDVGRALRHYDELAGVVIEQRERMVVTHGEPHRGNTIATSSGIVLIDWDTVLIAPPERDLWSLAAEDPSIIADYEAATGTDTNRDSLELYRLRWDLTEVAMFVGDFRREHDDTEDNRVARSGLSSALDPSRWAVPD